MFDTFNLRCWADQIKNNDDACLAEVIRDAAVEIERLHRELAEARKAAVPWRDLQDWYAAQCNGEWEHMYGIKIETLDNPGWWFRVDLELTGLIHRPFTSVSENNSSHGRWLDCKVNGIGEWSGSGDETRLAEIVTRFLDWAKPATTNTPEGERGE